MTKLKLGPAVVLALVLVAIGLPAWACSCVLGDPRDQLAEADGAFIGELVSKRPVTSNEQRSIYTFRVIEDVKRNFGRTVEVRAPTQGPACGIEMEIGERTGLFLYRTRGGAWSSSLCSQISPRALRDAAKPLPKPNGQGRTRLVVGGSFGRARVIALNAAARTLEYGFGGNSDVTHLDLCPGARKMVEVTQRYNERRNRWRHEVATRSVKTASKTSEATARFLWMKRFRDTWPDGVFCQNADGTRALLFTTSDFGVYAEGVIAYVRRGRIDKLRRISARDAVFDRGVAYLSSGRYGRSVVALDLSTGVKRRIAKFRRPIDSLSLSPDGTKLGGIEREHCRERGCSPSRLFLIRLSDRKVRRLRLEASADSADIVWRGNKRFVVTNLGAKAHTYNLRLKRVGIIKNWYVAETVVLEGRLFGVDYGVVMKARLPDGKARRVRRLPSPVVNALIAVR